MTAEQAGEIWRGINTLCAQAGRIDGCSAGPIYQSVTSRGGAYCRPGDGNPTIRAVAETIAQLERGCKGLMTASGMAAVSLVLLALLDDGDRVIYHQDTYDWTYYTMKNELPRKGVETVGVDLTNREALRAALEIPTKLVYFEPLSNPSLDVVDVRLVSEMAHAAGAKVAVDNTFATPILLQPLDIGADVVIHSATTYLCGHGDALGGVVVGKDEQIMERIMTASSFLGGVISPFNAFLIQRGIRTLAIRMERHCQNAQRLAAFLQNHPQVETVLYPGLPDHPGYNLAKDLMRGFGGIVSFVVAGGCAASRTFVQNVKLCHPWVSLGDVGTLVVNKDVVTLKEALPEGLVRVSVGIEDIEDIIADVEQALRFV